MRVDFSKLRGKVAIARLQSGIIIYFNDADSIAQIKGGRLRKDADTNDALTHLKNFIEAEVSP
jgi:hypothetical protein